MTYRLLPETHDLVHDECRAAAQTDVRAHRKVRPGRVPEHRGGTGAYSDELTPCKADERATMDGIDAQVPPGAHLTGPEFPESDHKLGGWTPPRATFEHRQH